jgi:hypothetical protein
MYSGKTMKRTYELNDGSELTPATHSDEYEIIGELSSIVVVKDGIAD